MNSTKTRNGANWRVFLPRWVLANTVGFAFGWAFGELVGQNIARRISWTLGQVVGAVIAEGAIWVMRWLAIRQVREFGFWRRVEVAIWLASELMGWIIGEGFSEAGGSEWVTAGAIWGTSLGAGIWVVFWFIKEQKQRRPRNLFLSFVWALFGFTIVNFVLSTSLAMAMEIAVEMREVAPPFIAWGVSGAVLGLLLGCVTGVAFVRLLGLPGYSIEEGTGLKWS